jgi:Ca2+/Na+ antiporter
VPGAAGPPGLLALVAAYQSTYTSCELAFEATDTDNDGGIDFQELKIMLESLGQKLNDVQVGAIFHSCDLNNDGIIQPQEFASVLWTKNSKDAKTDDEHDEQPGLCTRLDPSMIVIDRLMPPHEWIASGFTVVVLWVAAFTYIMVDAATRFGCFVNVPEVVMGLIVLAVGTSVPDTIASIAVAKKGHADMAAANAVGSNTFDILLGLGLPWLISCLLGKDVDVPVEELQESLMILVGSLIFYLAAVAFNKWVLNRIIGVLLLLIYLGAITFVAIRHYTHFAKQH